MAHPECRSAEEGDGGQLAPEPERELERRLLLYRGRDASIPITGQFIGANRETETVNLGLSTSWDVFTGFRRGNDSKAAKAGLTAAEASFANASYQQRYNTTIQFFTALAGREIVSVREQSVKRADEQLKAAVVRLACRHRDALRLAALGGDASGNTRVALSQAQANLVAAEAALARLIGYDGRVRAADDSAFYHPGVTIDTTMLFGGGHEPLARRCRARPRRWPRPGPSYKASKSTYWPQLALNGSWNYNGNNAEQLRPAEPAAGQPRASTGRSSTGSRGSGTSTCRSATCRWPRRTPPTPSTRCSR